MGFRYIEEVQKYPDSKLKSTYLKDLRTDHTPILG